MKFWWFQFEYLVIVLYSRMAYQVLVKILFVLIPNQVDLNQNMDFEFFDSREHLQDLKPTEMESTRRVDAERVLIL